MAYDGGSYKLRRRLLGGKENNIKLRGKRGHNILIGGQA